jgi:hypothetical protein
VKSATGLFASLKMDETPAEDDDGLVKLKHKTATNPKATTRRPNHLDLEEDGARLAVWVAGRERDIMLAVCCVRGGERRGVSEIMSLHLENRSDSVCLLSKSMIIQHTGSCACQNGRTMNVICSQLTDDRQATIFEDERKMRSHFDDLIDNPTRRRDTHSN